MFHFMEIHEVERFDHEDNTKEKQYLKIKPKTSITTEEADNFWNTIFKEI